jgi:translation elongation factor EF-Tu-like GTPase
MLDRRANYCKTFLMPVEDWFSITGRGTAHARLKQEYNTGDPVESWWLS